MSGLKESGKIKWFSAPKGFGFIVPDGGNGKDVFVHISAVNAAGLKATDMVEGARIEYELVENRGRLNADRLKLVKG